VGHGRVAPIGLLTIDQHGKALVECDAADIGLMRLLFDGPGHSGQAHGAQPVDRLVEHDDSSVVVAGPAHVGVHTETFVALLVEEGLSSIHLEQLFDVARGQGRRSEILSPFVNSKVERKIDAIIPIR
jgi:hypothetical protein